MRIVAITLLLAACATSALSPAERLSGCWSDRARGVSMRWTPDATHPEVSNGVLIASERLSRFVITPSDEDVVLCELEPDLSASRQCWTVAVGEGGSLEGGRAFVDRHGERLSVEVLGDGPRRELFRGRRVTCD
jgi:hypothetical protein